MQEIQFWRSFLQKYHKTKGTEQTRDLLLSFMLAETQKDDRIDLQKKMSRLTNAIFFPFCDLA